MSFLDNTEYKDFDIFSCMDCQKYTMSDVFDILQGIDNEFTFSRIYDYLIDTFFDKPDDIPADFYLACLDLLFYLEPLVDSNAIENICSDIDKVIALSNADLNGEDLESIEEGVTAYMQKANINRKKRKFFTLSKADLIKTKAERKLKNILTRSDRKKYYAANKQKIAKYNASRAELVKKGQHKVKLRRKV